MAVNTRIVTVNVREADGTPWVGGTVSYMLTEDSFVAGGTLPKDTITATTDAAGMATATLWTNAEGLRASVYRYTLPDGSSGEFVLPTGETPIALETLRTMPGVYQWAQTDLEDLQEVSRADIFATLANTSNPLLGDKLIGTKAAGALATGITVHDFLARFIYITDHGAVADGSTDIGPSLDECLTVANEGDTIIIPAAGTAFRWATTRTWSKRVNLMVWGNLSVSNVAMIRANVSGVALIGYGATVTHTPAAGVQSSGLLFYRKNTETGDVAGHYTGWKIAGFHFVNVSVRTTEIGRQNVRIPPIYTLLTGAMTAGQTVLTVREVPANLTTDMYARILLMNGVVELRQITAFDAVAKTITVASAYSNDAPINRRVTAVTVTTAALTLGQTVIPVELDDTTTMFPVGEFAVIALTSTRQHIAEITARGANSITLATGVALAVASGGALVGGLNDGSAPSGTDLSACWFLDLEFSHCRSNYTMEIAGGRDSRVERCYFHDSLRWKDPNDIRYFTEVDPTTVYSNADPYAAEWDFYFGEMIKATANTKNCTIVGCTFRRWVRTAVDAFASGNVTIEGCTFEDSYFGFALEAKFGPNDVTPPVPFRFIHNTVRRLPTYGILAGTPHSLIEDNTFEDIGVAASGVGTAIYLNGGHGASIGAAEEEEEEEHAPAYSTNIRCCYNRIARCAGSGIYLTEVSESDVSHNQITEWSNYPIIIFAAALSNTISNNTCKHPTAPGTTYIRLAGTVGTPSLHRFRDNMTDVANTEISVDVVEIPSFYTVNGYGEQTLALTTTKPTTANWRMGDVVRNTNGGKLWQRGFTDMYELT